MISFKYTGLYREPDKFTRYHDCLSKNAPLGWQVCVCLGGGGEEAFFNHRKLCRFCHSGSHNALQVAKYTERQ